MKSVWTWNKWRRARVYWLTNCDSCVWMKGNPETPPTRNWLSALLGKLWRWQKVAVLEPRQEGLDCFYIGFIPSSGPAMICLKPVKNTGHGLRCGMRVGHEDVYFFGRKADMTDVPLNLVDITTGDDPKYKDLLLF